MIDVMKRLAELDADNPNIVKEDANLAECGPMGMMGGMEPHRPPASFSINATAADGDEVAGMLSQIMNLAGVHKVDIGGEEPVMGNEPTGVEEPHHVPNDNEIMRSMLDTLNEPEDETTMTALPPPEAGADTGGDLDNLDGGDLGGNMGGMPGDDIGDMGGEPADLGDMADQVRNMADELSGTSKDELGLESYDNTPADPTTIPPHDSNKFAYNSNATNAGNRMDGNMPRGNATFEDQLYAEYKKFVSEAKAKCCCEEKSKAKCPVHGKSVSEAEEKTMSRAAKGMMKYGKEGMKALAKAGKDGKDLDKVRDKYNKYDESTGDYSAKKAAAGKDIGKPGKNFAKIEKSAGGGEKGKRIAGAVLAKLRAKG